MFNSEFLLAAIAADVSDELWYLFSKQMSYTLADLERCSSAPSPMPYPAVVCAARQPSVAIMPCSSAWLLPKLPGKFLSLVAASFCPAPLPTTNIVQQQAPPAVMLQFILSYTGTVCRRDRTLHDTTTTSRSRPLSESSLAGRNLSDRTSRTSTAWRSCSWRRGPLAGGGARGPRGGGGYLA